MRKIVAGGFVSLDGVGEQPDRFFTEWDDVVDARIPAAIATQDAVILGRRSYEEWAAFWPASTIEPFATFINGVTKYVATSRPLAPDWANTTVIDGDLVAFVTALRQQSGGDIGVHASLSVTQALLAADLVDELWLIVAPCLAGVGRRLLEAVPARRLETLRSAVSPSGYLLVDYRVRR